jgi:CBS domain containing-hemolysin-like protein
MPRAYTPLEIEASGLSAQEKLAGTFVNLFLNIVPIVPKSVARSSLNSSALQIAPHARGLQWLLESQE